jgi:metallo-beta-lactamase family protein
MLTITPFGAAGEVTGSCWQLEFDDGTVLVDCGAFQGSDAARKNDESLADLARSLRAVVLTHAHLDHCGRLPALVRVGFTGPIYATPATRDLAEIVLNDSAAISEHEHRSSALSDADVTACLKQFRSIEYAQPIALTESVTLRLVDAGHILGAASVLLDQHDQRIVVSGDLGHPGSAIVRDPTRVDRADVVVMEATYGDEDRPTDATPLETFIDRVEAALTRGGPVLIPAFSIERTQELLYAFFEHRRARSLAHIPIFLDSPMAIRATEVFRHYPNYYDRDATVLTQAGHDFFRFDGLHPTLTPASSRAIGHTPNPKIIIAGSGMLTGGRMLYHLEDSLANPRATVLFVGYQADGTLGRTLIDLPRGTVGRARRVTVRGRHLIVRATVDQVRGLSAHADQAGLLSWLQSMHGVRHVILGHADEPARQSFASLIQTQLGLSVVTPAHAQSVRIRSFGSIPHQ